MADRTASEAEAGIREELKPQLERLYAARRELREAEIFVIEGERYSLVEDRHWFDLDASPIFARTIVLRRQKDGWEIEVAL